MEWGSIPTAWAFLILRHERLTVLVPTCKSSEAFSQAGEGVLFCPTLWTVDARLRGEGSLPWGRDLSYP